MAEPRPRRNIERVNYDFFSVRTAASNGGQDERELIHREQVQSYFAYDLALRQDSENPPEVPAGYHLFREAHRRDSRTGSRFAFCEPNGTGRPQVVLPRTPPTASRLTPLIACSGMPRND